MMAKAEITANNPGVTAKTATTTMKALVFRGANKIAVEEVPIPRPKYGEAGRRVTVTTICGTDVHILNGEYPVEPGLSSGHAAGGESREPARGVTAYARGRRALRGAMGPCGQ